MTFGSDLTSETEVDCEQLLQEHLVQANQVTKECKYRLGFKIMTNLVHCELLKCQAVLVRNWRSGQLVEAAEDATIVVQALAEVQEAHAALEIGEAPADGEACEEAIEAAFKKVVIEREVVEQTAADDEAEYERLCGRFEQAMICCKKYNWCTAKCVAIGNQVEQEILRTGITISASAAAIRALETVMDAIRAEKRIEQSHLRRVWAMKKFRRILLQNVEVGKVAALFGEWQCNAAELSVRPSVAAPKGNDVDSHTDCRLSSMSRSARHKERHAAIQAMKSKLDSLSRVHLNL